MALTEEQIAECEREAYKYIPKTGEQCPFCRNTWIDTHEISPGGGFIAWCKNCHARGPGPMRTEEEAMAAWNHRA